MMTSDPPFAPAESGSEVAPAPPAPSQVRWLRWIVLAVVLGFVGLMGSCVSSAVVGWRANSEASEFAAKTMTAVAKDWDPDILVAIAAPEMLQAVPAEKLRVFIRFVSRRLGPLARLGEVQKGQWRMFVGTAGPAVLSWQYADCEFERGPGRITMQVVKQHGEWRVLTFNVNSDLLMEDSQP